MNLYIRFIILLIKRFFVQKPIDLFSKCRTSFIVQVTDLDLNFHMNNGIYLSIMDLGRMDLLIRSGVFFKLLRNGYYPVVVSEVIRFKKSLSLFQHFEMETYIDAWDEKDFYIAQKFFVNNEIIAEGYIRGRFKKRGRKSSLTTNELFETMGHPSKAIKGSIKASGLFDADKNLASKENI